MEKIDNEKKKLVSQQTNIQVNERPRIDLTWKDLTVDVKKKDDHQRILHSQNGVAKAGQMLAIMGPSGAGKTTMLSMLTNRLKNGENMKIGGEILANGVPYASINYQQLSAFVMQNDILMETMTPIEILRFTANLRLQCSQEEKYQKVDEIIEMLQLENCQNTLVGGQIVKGISGGERKRTSIGVELISDPSIIILDEPTSGLDSYTSFLVINILKNLSQEKQMTVVFTIHSPNSDIFQIFDRLLLLKNGETVYQGSSQDIIPYFEKINLSIPEFCNPSDYFMDILNDPIRSEQTLSFANYEKYQLPVVKQLMDGASRQKIQYSQIKNSFCYEISQIAGRQWINFKRNPMMMRGRIFQAVFIGFLFSSIYWKIGNIPSIFNDQNALQAQIAQYQASIFFLTTLLFMLNFQNVILNFPLERAVFLREENAGMYSTNSYYLGKLLVELPFVILFPFLLLLGIYWCVNYNTTSFDIVATFFIVGVANAVMANAAGILVGALFENVAVALNVAPAVTILFQIFCGQYVNLETMLNGIGWIQYISPFKYMFEALMRNQLENVNIQLELPNKDVVIIHPLDGLGFSIGLNNSIYVIVAFIVVFTVLGLVFLKLLTKKIS